MHSLLRQINIPLCMDSTNILEVAVSEVSEVDVTIDGGVYKLNLPDTRYCKLTFIDGAPKLVPCTL
jgi:hypothetical protein